MPIFLPLNKFRQSSQESKDSNQVVYIHCAQGHGRTGLFASLLLLEKGMVTSPEEADAITSVENDQGCASIVNKGEFINAFHNTYKQGLSLSANEIDR